MPAQTGKKHTQCSNEAEDRVDLEQFAKLAGFPSYLIRQELILKSKLAKDGTLSLKDLRSAMCQFLDREMALEN